MDAIITPTSALLLDKLFSEEILTIDISTSIILQEMSDCSTILRQCDLESGFFDYISITDSCCISFIRPNFYIKGMKTLNLTIKERHVLLKYTLEKSILERKIDIFDNELKILYFNSISIIHLENDYHMLKEIEDDIEINVTNKILTYKSINLLLKRKVDSNNFTVTISSRKIKRIIEQSLNFYDNLLMIDEDTVAFIMKDNNLIFKVFMSI